MSFFKMDINGLTNVSFHHIMAQFPMQEYIPLRIVCKHWKLLIETFCHEKKSLKLFGSKTNVLYYCADLVTFNVHENDNFKKDFCLSFTGKDDDLIGGKDSARANCRFLPSLFPNVDKLHICFDNLAHIDVPFLLAKWNNLSSLTIRHLEQIPKPVVTAINSLKSLKALNLLFETVAIGTTSFQFPKIKFPILGQLEQFCFNGYDADLVFILKQLGSNIRRLFVKNDFLAADWRKLLSIKPEFGRTVTHLTVRSNEINSVAQGKEMLELICAHMPSLVYLNLVEFNMIPIDYQVSQIARLSNLSETHFWPSGRYEHYKNSLLQAKKLPKLNSVKVLTVEPDRVFLVDHFCKFFPMVFPNLEELIIRCYNSDIGRTYGEHSNLFPNLNSFKFQVTSDRYERSLSFTGRHAKDYETYIYDRHMGWPFNFQKFNPNYCGSDDSASDDSASDDSDFNSGNPQCPVS